MLHIKIHKYVYMWVIIWIHLKKFHLIIKSFLAPVCEQFNSLQPISGEKNHFNPWDTFWGNIPHVLIDGWDELWGNPVDVTQREADRATWLTRHQLN